MATSSNLLSSIIRLHSSPLHILHIRDIEELFRVGAAHAQDRAPAFAVLLLLAVEAALVEPAVLLCVLAVRSCQRSVVLFLEELAHSAGQRSRGIYTYM